jgi:hypothetical protein
MVETMTQRISLGKSRPANLNAAGSPTSSIKLGGKDE